MIHKDNNEEKQSLNEVEEWKVWSQSLRDWISEHFGFAETKPLKEASLQTLNFVESEIPKNQLLSAIEEVNGVINFVDFLVHFGLSSGEEQEEVLTYGHNFYHFMVEESCWADSNLEVADLVKLLTSSKEEVINDFVIPFYKIPKSSSLDLNGLFENAFSKGIDRLTFGEMSWTHWVFDPIRESFSVSDSVGVFEYILEAQDEVLKNPENKFQTEGLKAGFSLHCLRQYPSGFPKGENSFPRAFIHRQDGEGKFTFDEMKHFIEGLPTELDRKVAKALLESRRSEDFAEGIELSFYEGHGGQKFTKGVRSCYNFDGVNALAYFLDIPCLNDTFGEEIHQIFRDYVSETDEDLLSIISGGNDWLGRSEQLISDKFGSNPSWSSYDEYGFILTLSERVKVPKKILKCYRKVANSVHNDYLNGNY